MKRSIDCKANSEKVQLINGWWSVKILSLRLMLNPDTGMGVYGQSEARYLHHHRARVNHSVRGTSTQPCRRNSKAWTVDLHMLLGNPHHSPPIMGIALWLSPRETQDSLGTHFPPGTNTYMTLYVCISLLLTPVPPLPHILQPSHCVLWALPTKSPYLWGLQEVFITFLLS